MDKTRFNPSPQVVRYGGAVIGVLLATALRLSLDPLINTNLPFTTYFVAVILTAIYFGLGPALLSMMLKRAEIGRAHV